MRWRVLITENDTDYNFSDVYVGLHYRLKTGKFTFTPGVSLHALWNQKHSNLGTYEYDNSFFKVLPDFETRIQFKKSEHFRLKLYHANSVYRCY